MAQRQVIINYWIGEKTNNSLDKIPRHVDIVPLAFIGVNDDFSINFDFLTQRYSAETIKTAIRHVRNNGTTRVLLSPRDVLTSGGNWEGLCHALDFYHDVTHRNANEGTGLPDRTFRGVMDENLLRLKG